MFVLDAHSIHTFIVTATCGNTLHNTLQHTATHYESGDAVRIGPRCVNVERALFVWHLILF